MRRIERDMGEIGRKKMNGEQCKYITHKKQIQVQMGQLLQHKTNHTEPHRRDSEKKLL